MPSDYTSKFSEKYGQLSGADMEILGAREQAATARALRNAFKPTQGQMVGGWYVKPTLTQNLADAMMQYNNYKNEQAGTAKAQELIDARNAATKANALTQAGLSTADAQPAYDREVTPASTVLVNPEDQATTREPQSMFTGEPAPTPNGAQAYVPPTTTATGNINANPTSNRYTTHLPTDAQELTASENVPLANAVRNAPLGNTTPGAVLAADIKNPTLTGGTASAPAEQILPREVPQESPANNEATARILRGENPFDARPARVENIAAVTERMPAVKGYNEGEWLAQQQKLIANDQFHAADAVGAYIKERLASETSKANAATADRKMQREGEMNRELRQDLATAQITDRKERDAQRVIDDKAKAQSEHNFRMEIQKIADATTRRGQNMRQEDRQDARAQALQGKLAKDEIEVLDDKGQPTGKVELRIGSPTWMKAKSDSSGEFQSLTSLNRGSDKLRNDIKSLLANPAFDKSFGQIGGRTADWDKDVQKVANLFRSIQAQFEARGLGINKQENGSIGALAVAEWSKMASNLAVVARTDEPKAARDAYNGALGILDNVQSAAAQKYQNEWGGGQFDLSKKSGSAPSGGVKKYNPDTGKIE